MDKMYVSAKKYFIDEYYSLGEFLGFSDYQGYYCKRILEEPKEDFLKNASMFKEHDYDSYKEFEETFSKKKEMSYIDFSELLNSKYGIYLKDNEKKNYKMLFLSVKKIKSIMVFFTIVWVISTLITVISLIILLGKFSPAY
ncbi:MAG: hypothetical protein WCX48_10515 [Bacteroidales bacterium]